MTADGALHVLHWKRLERRTIAYVHTALWRASKRLDAVTIVDLVPPSGVSSNGVYVLLKAPGDVTYVGKAESRSFVERIPANFDIRRGAWFSAVLKKQVGKKNASAKELRSALGQVRHWHLALIEVPAASIRDAETVLRILLEPKLNRAHDVASILDVNSVLATNVRRWNRRRQQRGRC